MIFPKQFGGWVLNAFLMCPPCLVSFLVLPSSGMPGACFPACLWWDAVSTRLLGFAFQLVSGFVFHLVIFGMLCLLSGFLVSGLAPKLVSPGLGCCVSCLRPWAGLPGCLRCSLRCSRPVFSSLSPSCRRTGLGRCVR